MDQLEKDFQAFMDALANEGVVRKMVVDGVNFYCKEDEPQYKEYLAREEARASESQSRCA